MTCDTLTRFFRYSIHHKSPVNSASKPHNHILPAQNRNAVPPVDKTRQILNTAAERLRPTSPRLSRNALRISGRKILSAKVASAAARCALCRYRGPAGCISNKDRIAVEHPDNIGISYQLSHVQQPLPSRLAGTGNTRLPAAPAQ